MSIELASGVAIVTLGGAYVGRILYELLAGVGWNYGMASSVVVAMASVGLGFLLLHGSAATTSGGTVHTVLVILFAIGLFTERFVGSVSAPKN